ncbi:MAG TPA: outer membrane protein transport protein [Polyangiaceae bacterium]|nr:outer membrane protein transport protein [Polyangiaceae bacterium]
MSTTRRFAAVLVAAGCSVVVPGRALASGFLTDQFGSDHGSAAQGNAYAVYFNPAAMAGAASTDITVDTVVAARSVTFNRTGPLSPGIAAGTAGSDATNPVYTSANTGQATLFNVLGAPFVGSVLDFGGSKFRLGIASYIPFGGQVTWDKRQQFANYPLAPGAYDGPQRWASISTQTSSAYGTLAGAYRFEGLHLGIGAGLSVIRTGVLDTRARDTDGSDGVVAANGGLWEGRSYLDVSGVQVGASGGLYWEPSSKLHFGASYTSAPSFGTMRLKGTFKDLQGQPTAAGQNPEINKSVDLLQAYPDVIRVGATWRVVPEAELRLEVTWQRWSQFQNQCIVATGTSCNLGPNGSSSSSNVILNLPRNWQDTVRVRLGGAYWVQPQTEVFGSFAYESSPVANKDQDPLLFDSTRLSGTLGVRYAFTPHLFGSLAYTYTYFVPVTVTNSAYGGYSPPSNSPNENGSYSQELYVFDGAVSYVF